MPRAILPEERLHPAIRERVARLHDDIVQEVQQAIAAHPVVVVGMAGNPHVARVKKALAQAGIAFQALDYGSYFSQWRRRNALKMWTGWPTLPMVFVDGQLVGGADDTIALLKAGELQRSARR